MAVWCRVCKAWMDNDHFATHAGHYEAFGIGTRDHVSNPRCGDVWGIVNGQYFVVDYVDSFHVGFTLDNGMRAGRGYRQAFEDYVQGGYLISTFEEIRFRYCCDDYGWSTFPYKVAIDESRQFLFRILDMKAKQGLLRQIALWEK